VAVTERIDIGSDNEACVLAVSLNNKFGSFFPSFRSPSNQSVFRVEEAEIGKQVESARKVHARNQQAQRLILICARPEWDA
jgi:hypothetical protein